MAEQIIGLLRQADVELGKGPKLHTAKLAPGRPSSNCVRCWCREGVRRD